MRRSLVGFACALAASLACLWQVRADDRAPVATGEYEISLGGKQIGREQFRIVKDKQYLVESTSTLYWPEPARHDYKVELLESSQVKKLEMMFTRAGLVTELKLEPHRKNWRFEAKGRGRRMARQDLAPTVGTEVDFGSPLFTGFIVRNLGLSPGTKRTVNVIVLALPDLIGKQVQHTYQRLEDEDIESKLHGKVSAAAFELSTAEATHRLWFDSTGFVLRATFDRPGGTVEHELVRLESGPDGW